MHPEDELSLVIEFVPLIFKFDLFAFRSALMIFYGSAI